MLDARTTNPTEMTTIKLSFLQWCVENAHLIVLEGFRDGVPGGLKNVTAILNKEIASGTAASKLLRDMMLQAGWVEVEDSQTLQLPQGPREFLKEQETQAYNTRLEQVRAALAGNYDNQDAFEQAVAEEMAPEEEGEQGDDGDDGDVEMGGVGAGVVVAHGDGWNVQDLLEENKPFYVKFDDEIYQMKVHSIDKVLQRPITVIWGVSQNQGGCFNDHVEDRNGYTHAQFVAAAQPHALVEHWEQVAELKTYGKRHFKISYGDKQDWDATLKAIDRNGHFVTIEYTASKETEDICIQSFFLRLTRPPNPKPNPRKKNGSSGETKSNNEYGRNYNRSKRSKRSR